MRRLLTISALLAASVLMTGQAFATHYQTTIFTAGCTGWSAEIEVRLYELISQIDLTYVVAIEDAEGNVILSTSGLATIVDDNADRYATVLIADTWDNATDEIIPLYGSFTVRGTFMLDQARQNAVSQPLFEDTVSVECAVVPTDDVTWSTLKSEYR